MDGGGGVSLRARDVRVLLMVLYLCACVVVVVLCPEMTHVAVVLVFVMKYAAAGNAAAAGAVYSLKQDSLSGLNEYVTINFGPAYFMNAGAGAALIIACIVVECCMSR